MLKYNRNYILNIVGFKCIYTFAITKDNETLIKKVKTSNNI